MEWYYIVAIIVAFVAITGVLIYLGKKGFISADMLSSFKTLVKGLSDLVSLYADHNAQNPTADMVDKAMELLEKAVLAAENMWYNGEINAEERYSTCVEIFNDLLATWGIELPNGFDAVMGSLIAAACEAMGHMRLTKAELEAQYSAQ